MGDCTARDQLRHEIEMFIKQHPDCTITDIMEKMAPKFDGTFPRTLSHMSALRRYTCSYVDKLVRYNDVTVGEHPTKTVKRKPMRTFRWRYKNGKD